MAFFYRQQMNQTALRALVDAHCRRKYMLTLYHNLDHLKHSLQQTVFINRHEYLASGPSLYQMHVDPNRHFTIALIVAAC